MTGSTGNVIAAICLLACTAFGVTWLTTQRQRQFLSGAGAAGPQQHISGRSSK